MQTNNNPYSQSSIPIPQQVFSPSAPTQYENIAIPVEEIKPKRQTLSIYWLPVYIIPWVCIFFLVLLSYRTLPKPLMKETETLYPNRFIGERAKLLNQDLANIGPKVVGSDAHMNAVQFILNEIVKISNESNPIHSIESDVQAQTGSFQLGSLTTHYEGIQNIVVKISPQNRTTIHSLLINTHYDSVPSSPGAGDAGILVAVMLEILRVLSQLPNTLQHSVVFLFNSAEEFELNGSHQFITQHIWASDVRAYINMDSCGTGGREILFQSTAYPWLLNYYKNTALHPLASVMGDELFKSGLIPSDTDFRIFRDFGQLRGFDFAVFQNGYIYHTKYDAPELIPMGTFQNIGDNILALTRAIANADELGSTAYEEDNGDLIFFDFIGWFMISYSQTIALIINVGVSVLALVGIIVSLISFAKNCDLGVLRMVSEFGAIIILQLVSIGVGIGVTILLSYLYDVGSRSMSWYSSPWLLFGIYFCPLFFCLGIIPSCYVMYRNTDVIRQSWYVQMFHHAQCFFLVLITFALTGLGIRSSFIIVISVIFYTLTTYINCFTRLQLRDRVWIPVNAIGQVIPFMFYSYYAIITLDLFVPIQGRNGPIDNPETMLSFIVIGFGILMGGLLIPTLYMFKRSALVMLGFLVIFLTFGIVMATNIGFPYRNAVSPKRFWIYHTERTFHNFDGTIRLSDSGLYMRAMDRNNDNYISEYVPQLEEYPRASGLCEKEMMCGLPSYQNMPTSATAGYSHWIPFSTPSIPSVTHLQLTNQSIISPNVRRFHFQLIGPDHMALSISPLPGNSMINWSFLDTEPVARNWGARKLYFMMIIYGGRSSPINFYVDIEKSSDEEPSVDIAVVSHFTYHKDYDTKDFTAFLDLFPDWTVVTSWISAYESWTY